MKEKTTMQIGMVGLGRMGANMVRRLLQEVMSAWSSTDPRKKVKDLVEEGAGGATSARRPSEETSEASNSCG